MLLDILDQRLLRLQLLSKGNKRLSGLIYSSLNKVDIRRCRGLSQRRQSKAHNLAQRTHIVVGNPLPQSLLTFTNDRVRIELLEDWLKAWVVGLLGGYVPHQTRIITTAAKLYDNGIAHLYSQLFVQRKCIYWLCQRQNYLSVKHGSSVCIFRTKLPRGFRACSRRRSPDHKHPLQSLQ